MDVSVVGTIGEFVPWCGRPTEDIDSNREETLSTYKIRIEFLILTRASQKRFLQWALRGFRLDRLPPFRLQRSSSRTARRR